VEASLKRADVAPGQRLTCPACDAFVGVVGGIRGTAFEEEGRRHFYTVAGTGPFRRSRCGPRHGVSSSFFRGVWNACGHWVVDHLNIEDDPRAHVARQDLPSWVPSLIEHIDFEICAGRGAAITVCAELLGVSPQQVYAQLT